MLKLGGIDAYYGCSRVLHKVYLEAEDGATVCIPGLYGTGNSTLPRALTGCSASEAIQPSAVAEIDNITRRIHAARNCWTLLVEQDTNFMRAVTQKFAIMENGRITVQGHINELRARAKIANLFWREPLAVNWQLSTCRYSRKGKLGSSPYCEVYSR